MSRPYVIIHTHTALDGNINGMDLPGSKLPPGTNRTSR